MGLNSYCLFHTSQSLFVDSGLFASTRLVFFTLVSRFLWTLACAVPLVLSFLTLVSRCWWTLACALPLVFSFFDIGQALLVDFALCAPTRLVFFFDIGTSLLAGFDFCASTRLVFFTLVSRCWWTLACALPPVLSFLTLVTRCWLILACALPLVLSFSHWSAAVGGIWLVRSHSSCLFYTGHSLLVDFDLCVSTRLVFFDIGQSLLLNFRLCAPTRLVFLTLVSYCWWTLTCALR